MTNGLTDRQFLMLLLGAVVRCGLQNVTGKCVLDGLVVCKACSRKIKWHREEVRLPHI